MHTTPAAPSRFDNMPAAQVIDEVQRLLAQYAAEDTARRERNAAILASL